MKKNILIISFNFWPENFPINQFAKNLALKKCNISVLTGKPNYPMGNIFKGYKKLSLDVENFFNNILIYRVPIIPRGKGGYVMRILNYSSFLLSSILCGTYLLKNKKYDHIFVYGTTPVIHGLVGIYFKLLKKCKLSIWLQDLLPLNAYISGYFKFFFLSRFVEIVINYIYRKSDFIFIQSKFFSKVLINIVSSKKIFYLPNSFKSNNQIQKIKINNFNKKKFNICYFGNLGLAQEFNTLIKSAKKINNSNINFHLFGEGLDKSNIVSKISKYKINYFFIHNYINPKYLKYLFKYSSVLFISLKKNKILNYIAPSKLQLYMLSKKTLLGEISGEGARIIKESKSGIVTKHNSVKDMVSKIKYLYKIKNTKKNKTIWYISI